MFLVMLLTLLVLNPENNPQIDNRLVFMKSVVYCDSIFATYLSN